MKRIFSILAIALTMLVSLAFGQPAFAEVSPGAKIFNNNCAQCHKGGGNNVVAAKTLKADALEKYGKNTVEALQSGTIYGFAGQVDGLVDRIVAELSDLYPSSGAVSVIATGGLAPLVLGISETIEFHEPDLTLIGLRLLYHRN